MIKTFDANLQGRDFIIGDLHGCYERVAEFVEAGFFDKKVDRLFSVGDIIDRGPDNEKCLELLYEPWFHSVMGNHEFMMMDYFRGGEYSDTWVMNGGMWGREHFSGLSDKSVRVRDTIREKVAFLPNIITVDMVDGRKFHVIHAELSAKRPITDVDLADINLLSEVSMERNYDGPSILWGRNIFRYIRYCHLDEHKIRKYKRFLELDCVWESKMFTSELSMIYSGHTIIQRPVRVFGQTCLDTSAYGSYDYKSRHGMEKADVWAGLTVTEPLTDRFWIVNGLGVSEVKPLIL